MLQQQHICADNTDTSCSHSTATTTNHKK